MGYPDELPSILSLFIPAHPSPREIDDALADTDGCQRVLLELAKAEMGGADEILAGAFRTSIYIHMHAEFPDEVGYDQSLTRELYELGNEGTFIIDRKLVSAFPSADDIFSYICNIFSVGEGGRLTPVDNPIWTDTACLAHALAKCIGDDPDTPIPYGKILIHTRAASDCDLDADLLLDDIAIDEEGIERLCMEACVDLGGEYMPALDPYFIASCVADYLLDPYEVADAAEFWQTPDIAWDEAIHEIELQLQTPSGREFVLEALKAEFDDDAIDRAALDGFSLCIHGLGPVAGFPLGQTTTTHGFMATDYVRATLDASEQEALADALAEVLSEEFGVDGVERLVEDALDSRIADISCMDAAGFINRLREQDDAWRHSADSIAPEFDKDYAPDVGVFQIEISGEER